MEQLRFFQFVFFRIIDETDSSKNELDKLIIYIKYY